MRNHSQLNTADILKSHQLPTQQIRLTSGDVLDVLQVVRVVPKRRIVCKAVWRNQTVYAKLFLGQDAAKYAARDKHGVTLLQNANVDTPALLAEDAVAEISSRVLIYAAIENSVNAEDYYHHATPQQRYQLMLQLMQVLATHHQAGLLQTDLYLKNFLIAEPSYYTIDGDGIREFRQLGERQSLQNVSQLLSKIDVLELEAHLADWMGHYANSRQWQTTPDLNAVKQTIRQARERALTQYADKKVFRTCTDVSVIQNSTQFGAYSNAFFEVLEPLSIDALDNLLNTNQTLKMGNTCTVGMAPILGQSVVIKRYNIKNVWHGLGRAVRQSRAAVSWANAHRLQLLAIATPQPVALIEQRRLNLLGVSLKGKCYFLSAYVQAPDVAEFFAKTQDKMLRAEAVKQIVQLFYRLHLLRLSHGDMKATNIKMPSTSPMLIDLDSMQQHRWDYFAHKAHARDLRRFMQNWKDDASLYNAFIKVFKVVYADHAPLHAANILK